MIKRLKKYMVPVGAMILVLTIVVPPVATYEGEVIRVKAHVVAVPGEATRGPGWWQTHPAATQWILENKDLSISVGLQQLPVTPTSWGFSGRARHSIPIQTAARVRNVIRCVKLKRRHLSRCWQLS